MGSKSPAFKGRASLLTRELCNIRVDTVWNELKLRCSQAQLQWEDTPGKRTVTWSRVGRKTLLITSWTHVLEGLLHAARSGGPRQCAP